MDWRDTSKGAGHHAWLERLKLGRSCRSGWPCHMSGLRP